MSTSFTKADLENIEQAIASGTLKVQRGDKMVQYHIMNDLKAAHSMIKNALDEQNNQSRKGKTTYATFRRD